MCVPSACTHLEVETVLREELFKMFENTEISTEVEVKENRCQTKDSAQKITVGAKFAM